MPSLQWPPAFVYARMGLPLLTMLLSGQAAIAQLIPDATLGSQSSTIETTGLLDTVQGGHRVGSNLFHSFREFNVGAGRSLYFSDPGVANILTRVTGANPSQIDGRLGVNGAANLFLLNPNGIIFGAGASLDVRGSFTASTAPAIQFADGSEFSATQPTANLLTISVPLGLQRGSNAPTASIINRGTLQTGQDLTLEANTLDLQGQLQAGRDLSLQATDTVTIRDTVTTPFLARSGGAMTIQGDRGIDILALNHLSQTPFVSDGAMTLISDGNISADAHFASQGFFLLKRNGQPGDFVSRFDPIIRANGDVVFGNYTGVSLKVEATGSIEGGDIFITDPDLTIPIGDPDVGVLTSERAVILRAGLPAIPPPNLPQATGGTNFAAGVAAAGQPPGSIVVGNMNTSDIGSSGVIQLSAPGTITTGNIFAAAASLGFAGDGGRVEITAGRDIRIQGDIDAYSQSTTLDAGNGGTIRLTSQQGSITTGGLSAYAWGVDNAGDGGQVTVTANGNLTINGTVDGSSVAENFAAGNGGAIALTSSTGRIIANGDLLAYTYGADQALNGGNITLTTTDEIVTNGFVDTSSSTQESVSTTGTGGAIAFSTTTGNIIVNQDLSSYSYAGGDASDGGAITLRSGTGNITTNNADLASYSASDDGNSATGGAITVTTQQGNINLWGDLDSDAYAGAGNAGTGGNILVSAPNGQVIGNPESRLTSYSVSEFGSSGNGGTVTVEAQNRITQFEILTLSSTAQSGSVQLTGLGHLAIEHIQVLTSKQLTLKLCRDCDPIPLNVGGQGKSGNVSMTSGGNLTLQNSRIESDAKGSEAAGNIAIASGGQVTLNQSQISSNTSSTGQAGNITVAANEGLLLTGASTLSAETRDRGNAGSIAIATPQLTVNQGSKIGTTTTGAGTAGNIQIQTQATTITGTGSGIISGSGTPDQRGGDRGAGGNISLITDSLQLADNGIISTSTFTQGQSGSIDVTARTVELTNGGKLSATTQNQGSAGNIRVNAREQVAITGNESAFLVSTTPEASGNGGNVTVTTGRLAIGDRGKISADSQGSGQGGDVAIVANQISLQNLGQIIAETATSNGGNINLQVRDLLILRNQSLISASAGTAQSGGNGGNVTINAGFVVASLAENSDIRANAFTGNGGRVNITAKGIFGLRFQPQATPLSDITASSSFGTSGTVTLTTLNVDPNRGLVQLPAKFTDTSNQIAQACSPREQGNSFIVTGRGGVALNPGEVLSQAGVWGGRAEGRGQGAEGETSAVLVEANGWRREADGSIALVAAGAGGVPAIAPIQCPPTTERR